MNKIKENERKVRARTAIYCKGDCSTCEGKQNEPAPRELFDAYEICSAAALDQKQCLMYGSFTAAPTPIKIKK